jgi:hypothetical protein
VANPHFDVQRFRIWPGISAHPGFGWSTEFYGKAIEFSAVGSSTNFYGAVIDADETGTLGPCLSGALGGVLTPIRVTMRPWPDVDDTAKKNQIHVLGANGRQIFSLQPEVPGRGPANRLVGRGWALAMSTFWNPYNNTAIGIDFGPGPCGY